MRLVGLHVTLLDPQLERQLLLGDLAMHIRAYRDSDLPLLCQIFLRAVRETASRDYTPGQIAAWAQVDGETRWRQKAGRLNRPGGRGQQPAGWLYHRHRDAYRFAVRLAGSLPARGIGGALIEALCAQYPAQILTVDASITAKPCFTAHGLRWWLSSGWRRAGSGFINYRMENAWR